MTVEATGTGPLSYQWYRSGPGGRMPIPGATSARYTARPAGTELYDVVVSNACGSETVFLRLSTCNAAPVVAIQPTSQVVVEGLNALLFANTIDPGPFRYQWYEGDSGDTSKPVSTNQVFATPPLRGTVKYWVRLSNACGSTDSPSATLSTVPALEVRSIKLRTNASGKTELLVTGRNFLPDTRVLIDGSAFAKPATVGPTRIVQAGKLYDGRSLKAVFTPGRAVRVTVVSPSVVGATIDTTYTRH